MESLVPCEDTGKAECDTKRVSPEHLARPISQACTGIAVQPAASVLVPAGPLQSLLETLVPQSPRGLAREIRARRKKIIVCRTECLYR